MASLIPVRQSGRLVSLVYRTAKRTPATEHSIQRLSSHAFGTACLQRQTQAQTTASPRTSRLRSYPLPRQNRPQSIRWNSEYKTPVFKEWGFEDINAALPSESTSSPPHTPQKNLILIDVREPAELTSTGIIPTAVSVPLASQPDALFLTPDEFETRFGFPKPGVEEIAAAVRAGEPGPAVVFYCKAGVRARAAAQLAVQAGYDADRIGVYDGSWLDWAARGGRVVKWDGSDYE